jgi:hypothetical protein
MAGGIVKTLQHANLGDVLNVGFGIADYRTAREQGDSKAVSAAKAVGSFAWGEIFYGGLGNLVNKGLGAVGIKGAAAGVLNFGLTAGISVAMTGAQIISATGEHTTRVMNQTYRNKGKLGNGYFPMTEAGYTMRQRSLNAIRSNGLNTRSVLGNEARNYSLY